MTGTNNTDVLVAGAGLAGLTAAWLLQSAGLGVRVLEAQDRCGGRIHSVLDASSGEALADLGPSWIWTPYQAIAADWLERLQLSVFAQFDEGLGVVDQGDQAAPITHPMPGQHGSMRVVGTSQAMIDRLLDLLPTDTVQLSRPVTCVSMTTAGVEVVAGNDANESFSASHLLVAMPVRRALHSIDWQPGLPEPLRRAIDRTPTWMAPHAKAVIIYEQPFWRERGLSGRVASQVGPLVEAHDHCGPEGEPAALFGFVGWSAEMRASHGAEAVKGVIDAQLARCFGPGAPRPTAIHVQDWAQCPFIADPRDLAGPMAHPSVGPQILRAPQLDGRVQFCASETAGVSPGLVEGAFAAAQQAVSMLLEQQTSIGHNAQ